MLELWKGHGARFCFLLTGKSLSCSQRWQNTVITNFLEFCFDENKQKNPNPKPNKTNNKTNNKPPQNYDKDRNYTIISPHFCSPEQFLLWKSAAHMKFLLLMKTACSMCKENNLWERLHMRIQDEEAADRLVAFLPSFRKDSALLAELAKGTNMPSQQW